MLRVADALHGIAVTLWVGGLWTVGLLVAPMLFLHLDDRALAGDLAGRSFAAMAYVGMGCGAYLLLFLLLRFRTAALRQGFLWVTLLMLLLVAAGQFGVQPILANLKEQAMPKQVMESVFRARFAAWHGVASVLYLIESALGLVLVVLQGRRPR